MSDENQTAIDRLSDAYRALKGEESLEARKRREMEEAIESGAVADPFITPFLVSLAVSAATTAASFLITRAFAPKPKPIERGRFVGDLMMGSEQGVMIPEIYGGAPGDNLGGLPVGGTIIWTSGIRKHTTVTRQPTGGGKMGGGGGQTQEVREITYDLDVATVWCRGPALVRKEWANADEIYQHVAPAGEGSGVFDPAIPIDSPYDPELPPDPALNYDLPITRHRGSLVVGGQNQRTGTLLHGAYSSVVIYEGNTTQLVDSTIQAAVDAAYGANSTPAYRNRCYTRHANFSLSRWGGVMPNLRAVVEHKTLKTLDVICAHWCSRVNMLVADYSFTNLSAVTSRGLMISGRRYQPAEVMDGPVREFYNVIFCEPEGVLTGYVRGTTPSVTIDDSEIGWLETDEIPDGPMPEIDTSEADATKLPRRVDVKFIDPEKDWQPNTQGESRQITDGEESQVLEVQICAKASEARAVAARKLYQPYVERLHRFTLSWKYLYLYPGYQIIVTRDEGFTYRLELTSIRGGIGLLECEAVDLEPATYAPPVTGAGGQGFEMPPVPIPVMTIVALMDTPLLRDKDETINNGSVFYACGTPRTNNTDQVYQGFSLYVNKVGWERIADFTLPATQGRARTVLATATDTSVFDNTNSVTVDLYGTTQTLASASEADVLNGQNAALLGDEVIQFRTATRDGAGPNRWILSGLLRGRRGTEYAVSTHIVNERFILLNEAVQPVPISIAEMNVSRSYKAVTVGQSLDDAATVSFVWTGGSVKTPAPKLLVTRMGTGSPPDENIMFEFTRGARVATAIRSYAGVPVSEEQLLIVLECLNGANVVQRFEVRPQNPVEPFWQEYWQGTVSQGAFWQSHGGFSLKANGANPRSMVESFQWIDSPGMFEFELSPYPVSGGQADFPTYIGLYRSNLPSFPYESGTPKPDYWFNLKSYSSGYAVIRAEDAAASEAQVKKGDKLAVVIDASSVSYYVNYVTGQSRPIYVSPRRSPEGERFRAIAYCINDGVTSSETVIASSALRSRLLRAVYPVEEIVSDYGATKPTGTLSIRYWQESTFAGQGVVAQSIV